MKKYLLLSAWTLALSWFFIFRAIGWGVPSSLVLARVTDGMKLDETLLESMKKARDIVYKDTKDHVQASPFLRKDEFAAQKKIVADYARDGATIRFANYLRHFLLCTCDPDESGVMNGLANIKPARFEFNPHNPFYGGGFFYPLGAALKALDMAGVIKLVPDMKFYFRNIDELGKVYTAGRAAVAAAGTAGLLILVLFSFRLSGSLPWAALLAVLLTTSPITLVIARVLKPHFPIVLLSALCTLAVHRFASSGEKRWFFVSAALCGLMTGTIIYAALFALLPLLAYLLSRPERGGESLGRAALDLGRAALLLLAGAFLLNPYWLSSPGETLASLSVTSGKTLTPYSLRVVYYLFRYGAGIGGALLFLAAAAAGLAGWKKLPVFNKALLAFLLISAALLGKLPDSPGYTRYAIFLLPLYPFFAVETLRALRWGKPELAAAFSLAFAAAGVYDALRIRSYPVNDADLAQNTRLRAAEWITATIPGAGLGHLCDLIPWTFPPVSLAKHRVSVYLDAADLLEDEAGAPGYLVTAGYQLNGLDAAQRERFAKMYALHKEFSNPVEVMKNEWEFFSQNMTIYVYKRLPRGAGRGGA